MCFNNSSGVYESGIYHFRWGYSFLDAINEKEIIESMKELIINYV